MIDIDEIRAEMKRQGITQTKLAAEVRLQPKYINKILMRKSRLYADLYARICAVLNCPMEKFVKEGKHDAELGD